MEISYLIFYFLEIVWHQAYSGVKTVIQPSRLGIVENTSCNVWYQRYIIESTGMYPFLYFAKNVTSFEG